MIPIELGFGMEEADLWDLINAAWDRMTFPQKRLWEMVRIDPEKWSQHPYGDEDGGFWAVALIGRSVMWFNHLDRGFNRSGFIHYGEIKEFGSNQFDLHEAIQHLLNELEVGYATTPRSSPPLPGEFRR